MAFYLMRLHARDPLQRDKVGLMDKLLKLINVHVLYATVSNSPISCINAAGESTTPLPIKQVTLSRKIPDGIKRNTVFHH